MRLVYFGAALLFGIYLGLGSAMVPVWTVYPFAAAATGYFLLTRRFKALLLFSVCLVLLAAGFWRGQAGTGGPAIDDISRFNGRGTAQLTGVIVSDPEILDREIRFTLEVERVSAGGPAQPASGLVLVVVSRLAPGGLSREFPYFRYGDTVAIRGPLKAPENVDNFDYRGYLASRGILSQLRSPAAITITGEGDRWLISSIYRLRAAVSKSLQSVLPEPQAALAQGILLGVRTGIPRSLSDAFANTGTTHVLAISGQNLTIIAGLLIALGVWLFGRRHQVYLLLPSLTIWFYAVLTGFVPSVVRASVMATAFLAAHFLGRPRSGGTATVLSAALMAVWEPAILADVSFQLSFLAILGLVYLAPHFERAFTAWLRDDGDDSWQRNFLRMVFASLSVTMAATMLTIPVLAHTFQTVSLVSAPATLLLLPVLPAIILLTGAAGFLGLISLAAAQVVAWADWLPLSYMALLVRFFDRLPLASVHTSLFTPGAVSSYYLLLAGSIWAAGRPDYLRGKIQAIHEKLKAPGQAVSSGAAALSSRKWFLAILVVAACLTWLAVLDAPDGRLHLTFFTPEEGGGVLLRTPGGQNVLIHGGPSPDKLNAALGAVLPFQEKRIDLLVVTSTRASQLPGVTEALRRYRIGQILEPDPVPLAGEAGSKTYLEWRREVKTRDIPFTAARAGQTIALGQGFRLQVLATQPEIMIKVQAGDVSFLIDPPADKQQLLDLAASGAPLRSTVLRLSTGATHPLAAEEIFPVIQPQYLVAARDPNQDPHQPPPKSDSMTVLPLDASSGALELVTDGKELWTRGRPSQGDALQTGAQKKVRPSRSDLFRIHPGRWVLTLAPAPAS